MGKYSRPGVPLTEQDLAVALTGPWIERFPPLLTAQQAAELLQVSINAIYHLRCEGRLDGTFTKIAGKLRFWRDRLIRRAMTKGL